MTGEWVSPAVDAVMTYWLNGMDSDPDSAEALGDWWASGEAPEAALEIVYAIRDAIEHAGWAITKQETP